VSNCVLPLKWRQPIEALSSELQQRVCGGREHVKRPTQLPSVEVVVLQWPSSNATLPSGSSFSRSTGNSC
jgi:hypothetical protein